MPRRKGSFREIRCATCKHAERGRIDYLLATGQGMVPLARRFGLPIYSVRNHAEKHLTAEYVAAVRAGPLQDEEALRKLCASNGVSVVENLSAIYAGLAARWLHAFEAGDDQRLIALTTKLHANLEIRARISKELAPAGSNFVTNNNFLLSDASALLQVLTPFPEARAAIVRHYTAGGGLPAPLVIEHADAAD